MLNLKINSVEEKILRERIIKLTKEYVENFGNNGISSPFQDGGYIYLVIAGSGCGTSAIAPAIIVADVENPAELHKTLTP